MEEHPEDLSLGLELSNGKDVQLLLLDCDGVLTDGGVTWSEDGIEQKTFNIRDGLGIKLWQRAGFQVGIVTGRSSQVVKWRATELSIDFVRQGVGDKLAVVSELIRSCNLDWDSVAYIGDDLPDLPVIRRVGFGVAVADACSEVLSPYRTTHSAFLLQQESQWPLSGVPRRLAGAMLDSSIQPQSFSSPHSVRLVMRQTRWDYTTTARVTTTHISGETSVFRKHNTLKERLLTVPFGHFIKGYYGHFSSITGLAELYHSLSTHLLHSCPCWLQIIARVELLR